MNLRDARHAQARRLLTTQMAAETVAVATGLSARELQQVAGDLARDALCRSTAQGFRPQAHVRRYLADGEATDEAIAKHAGRIARAKPLTAQDEQAAIAAFLAKKGATHCPPGAAAGSCDNFNVSPA